MPVPSVLWELKITPLALKLRTKRTEGIVDDATSAVLSRTSDGLCRVEKNAIKSVATSEFSWCASRS